MKPLLVVLLAGLAATCAFAQQPATDPKCPAASAERSAPSQWVIGAWRHVELSRYVNERQISSVPFKGENVLRFGCDMKWSLDGPQFKSSGTYRWVGPDRLEQTIVDSNIAAQRGQVSVKRIVAGADALEMHTDITAADLRRQQRPARIEKPDETVHAVSRFQRMSMQ